MPNYNAQKNLVKNPRSMGLNHAAVHRPDSESPQWTLYLKLHHEESREGSVLEYDVGLSLDALQELRDKIDQEIAEAFRDTNQKLNKARKWLHQLYFVGEESLSDEEKKEIDRFSRG